MSQPLAYAYGGPVGTAVFKAEAEDFCVTEQLSFEPSGSGEHVFLHIQKRELNTHDLLDRLRKLARVKPLQLGYCGLKDKRAVTRQWFSIQVPAAHEPDWHDLESGQIKLLAVTRHGRKLRVGAHSGNSFKLRLLSVDGSAELLQQRLLAVAERGFPNYFGPQRFGFNNNNIDAARRLFANRDRANRKLNRKQQLYLSAARSHLFNALLSNRVADRSWTLPLEGDVFQFDGAGTLFRDRFSAEIGARLERGELHITGPLWGSGELLSSAAAAALEHRATAVDTDLAEGLEAFGIRQQRRALRANAKALAWQQEESVLELQFDLVKGSYATVLLRELLQEEP